MIKRGSSRLALNGAIAALAITIAVDAAEAQTIRYGSFVPERSSANKQGVFPMMKKIEALTAGRVKFKASVGGTIISPRNTLSGIRDGVVDAGFMVTQFHIQDLPYTSLLSEFTGLGTNWMAALGAYNEAYFIACRECRKEMAKQGLSPLFAQTATPLNMVCRKPVNAMTDLKGLRLSATGAPEMRWGASLGMTPRRQNFRQFVQAMQLGQTDCFMGPPAWIRSYGLTDVAKAVITMPQGVLVGAMPMLFNTKAMAKIGAADRKAIAGNMAQWVYDYVKGAYVDDDVAVKKMLAGKVAFSEGGGDLKTRWAAYQKGEIPALIKLARSRKLKDGEALVNRIAAVFQKWHTKHMAEIKGDPKAFVRVLDREVFSKVTY